MVRSRPKMLLVIPSLLGGGAERVFQLILSGISREDYQVKAVVFNGDIIYELPKDIEVINLNKRSGFDFVKLILRLAKLIRKENPAMVMSFMTYANIITIFAKILSRMKVALVLSEHNQASIHLRHEKYFGIKAYLIKKFYKISDVIIAVSKGCANDLSSEFGIDPGKITIINNPVDMAEIKKSVQEEVRHPWFNQKTKPTVISVGRLVPQKNQADLLKAFALVRKEIDSRLVIIGEGPEKPKLKKLASDLGIDSETAFFGFQKNPFKFMAHSDVFVLSSLWEGFGNVLVEAMASGSAVVSTRCPSGPDEIIAHGIDGFLVRCGDVTELAEKIKMLLKDERMRSRFTESGLTKAAKYDLNNIMMQYNAVFKCLV